MRNPSSTLRVLVTLTLAIGLLAAVNAVAIGSEAGAGGSAAPPGPTPPPTHRDERPAWIDAGDEDLAAQLEQHRNPAQEARTVEAMPQEIVPDPLIQQMISQVDLTTVYSMTGELSGEWAAMIGDEPYIISNRNTYGGAHIQHATQYVYEHLAANGLDTSYHVWEGASYPNVIGELPGVGRPDEIVLITAHLDDMPTGPTAPGADDNASGSIGVLVAAQILSRYQWDCTLRFVTFTGEEQGLLGSWEYAEMVSDMGENILGVLNLDMIAYNSDAYPTIELHTRPGNPGDLAIANLFDDVVDAYGINLNPQIEEDGISASDHYSFWQHGYSAILGIEDFEDFTPYYHTTGDRLDTLDMDYYTEFVRASVGTFAHMGCLLGDVGAMNGTVTDLSSGLPLTATVTALGGLAPVMTTSDATGYYTMTLPVDSYTVTARAHLYGYYPTTITHVSVITNEVTLLDLPLAPYPRQTISGTVSDALTGAPLIATLTTIACPEGPCHSHTGTTVTTDPLTGYYSATLISGTYTLRVHADGYRPVVETIVVDRDQTRDFPLLPQGCVLLVDDDGGAGAEALYQSDLDGLALDYATWTIQTQGTPSLSLLEQYHQVLWLTGSRFSQTLTSADRALLSAYLDGGGNLFLSSWGVGGDLDGSAFLADTLHADYQGDVFGGDISLSGAGFLAGYPLTVSTLPSQQVSKLTPLGGAIAVYGLPAPYDSPAAVAYDGDYDLVYLGFGLESVNDQISRRAALQAILDWLGPCAVPAPVPSFTSSSPDLVGTPTTFTNATVGAEPITYAWDFGDGLGSSTEVHPVYTYAQVGSYTVWLTATNAGGSAAVSATVEITGTPPIAAFQHSAPVFLGNAVLFTNTTTPGQPPETSYLWDFGDDLGTSAAEHPVYTYTQAGTYTVWLTAANLAGSDAISTTVQVLAPPEPPFRVLLPVILR